MQRVVGIDFNFDHAIQERGFCGLVDAYTIGRGIELDARLAPARDGTRLDKHVHVARYHAEFDGARRQVVLEGAITAALFLTQATDNVEQTSGK